MPTAIIELDSKNQIVVIVGGQRHVLDVEADTDSGDLSEDMEIIAGTLGWYTQVLAAARHHNDLVEAGYRAWQAGMIVEILSDDPRLAEWKAKGSMAAEPEFMEWKAKQADAWRLVNRLDGAVKALVVKADMLRSRGAMMRTEITHLDRSLPGPRTPKPMGKESVESKEERLKRHLKG